MPVSPHPISPHPIEWYSSVLNWIISLSIDKWQKFVQIVALVLGGIGAYIRWFKGRIYRGRLESKITGAAVWENDNIYINVVTSIKNIGLAKLDVDQRETALRLSYCTTRTNVLESSLVFWEHIGTFCVFENDHFIESGETIQDEMIIAVPKINVHAFQLELGVSAGRSIWKSRAIVIPEDKVKQMKLLTGQAPRYQKARPDEDGGTSRRYSNRSSCCVCNWRYSP